MSSVLVAMILFPLAGSAAVALAGSARPGAVRAIALSSTLITLLLAALVVGRFEPRKYDHKAAAVFAPQMETIVPWITFALTSSGSASSAQLSMHLGIDGLSLWLVGLTALLMVSGVLISWESIKDRPAEFYAWLLALETGMLGVFCSFDIILFYVFFEFTLIPLYFLIGIWGGPQKTFAAGRFFIYTLTGSVISLLGLLALAWGVFSASGTLTFSIPELAATIRQDEFAVNPDWATAQMLIFLALFIGFAIKVPLFPFHTWLPLAHVEAPTAGSVLLAGVLLKLGSYGFLRLALPLLPAATVTIGVPLVATLAVVGILYGALCALWQTDIKRLVAYSSVSHLGFCMLGMFALNEEGVSGSLLQMVNHGLSTGALFLLVGMIYERYHTRQLRDLGGLANRLPLLACFLVFISLSSVGLPGLNGFVGEMLALIGMFKAHKVYAVFGTFGIVLGAWYLFQMLRALLFGPLREPAGSDAHGPILDLRPREVWSLVPIAAFCVLIGVLPQPFLKVIDPDVKSIVRLYGPVRETVRTEIPVVRLPDEGLQVASQDQEP